MFFKDYKKLKDFSVHRDMIYKIKEENIGYAKLESYAIWSETFAEISKTKFDTFKALSPILLIVFFLGYYTSSNRNINKEISIFSTDLLLGELLMHVGIGIPVFYFYFIYTSFLSYRNHMRTAMNYKAETTIAKAIKEVKGYNKKFNTNNNL